LFQLIVFNNNPGGIMIEEKAWYRHLGDRSGSSCTQFRELMLAMLKKKALYFVSLDGLSFRVGNKIIYLPAVHTELKKAVYSRESFYLNYLGNF
jgi:hypothetical protein